MHKLRLYKLILIHISLWIFFTLISSTLFSQNKKDNFPDHPLNSFNLSFLGDASLISANYELLFQTNKKVIIGGKLGLGYNEELRLFKSSGVNIKKTHLTIPHGISFMMGLKKHFLEAGIGGTIIAGNTSQNYILYPLLGYRFIPIKSNNINFRIFFEYPLTGTDTYDVIFVPFGISIGISF